MAVLIVHGGSGAPPESQYAERRAAVERALETGWAAFRLGALEAVLAAVRHMEDEPMLNAGVGASVNLDGEVELDAGVMEGTTLRAGAVGAVRDVRHPVDLARAVMEDGRHVLLVADGASRFARERGVETCAPETLVTERQLRNWRSEAADTVGAVARDDRGRTAVAVSTGGMPRKRPGRLGDSPVPGAGFYADDRSGAACGTGVGEGFMRLCLCHLAVLRMGGEASAEDAAREAIEHLAREVGGSGGVILVDARGRTGVAHNTPFMAWSRRTG
jgi:beta-aspartyl-peptidase (threonine type)